MAATLGSKPLPTIPILRGIGSSSSVEASGPSVASGAVQKPLLTIPILSGIRSSSSIGDTSGPSVARGAVQKELDRKPSSVTTINAASIMDVKPRIAQRRPIVVGLTCKRSSNAGGSQSESLQVPSGSGSGAHGRGSRGRAPVGLGSGIKRDNNVNPRKRNDMGPPPRMALSNPSVLGEMGEQSGTTGVLRIGNLNIGSSLISAGSGSSSRGLLVRSSGINRASDVNLIQRNVMASPRIMSDMNQNQMQQTNPQPASVSPSVSFGASRPSENATNQSGSTSKD